LFWTPKNRAALTRHRNTIDEQKNNYGAASGVTKDIGANMTGNTTASDLKARLGGSDAGAGDTTSVDRKAEMAGAKIGGDEDAHDLAAAKQP